MNANREVETKAVGSLPEVTEGLWEKHQHREAMSDGRTPDPGWVVLIPSHGGER